MISLINNTLKLKNLYIEEFTSKKEFEEFKNNNPQYIVYDVKFIPANDYTSKYKIFLIYQKIKNNDF